MLFSDWRRKTIQPQNNVKNTVAFDYKGCARIFSALHSIMQIPNRFPPGHTVSSGSSLWLLYTVATVLLFGQQIVAAENSAADYYIRSLPGQPEGDLLKMHAG